MINLKPDTTAYVEEKTRQIVGRMQGEPLWFMEDVLNAPLWEKQRQIVRAAWNYPRTTVRGCHSFGKSFIAGNLIVTFLYSYKDSIVISTAPTWRQVEKLIWKEVRASYGRSTIPLGGDLLPASPELHIVRDQWYAAGLSTNDPNKFQGFHAKHILIVVDEGAGVSEPIFEALEGAMASQDAHLLIMGNPTKIGGTFHRSFKEPGWQKIAVSAFDTPNFTELGITEEDIATGKWQDKVEGKELPYPMMVTPDWVADKYKRWGPQSVAYVARVTGNFPEGGDDTVIPLSWIEAAMERWHEVEYGEDVELGIDPAEFGNDETVIAIKAGRKIKPLLSHYGLGVMETAGVAVNIIKEEKPIVTKVDVIGIGTGVEGRLKELGHNTLRVNVAEHAKGLTPKQVDKAKESFFNLRAQMYWALREALDPDPLVNSLPLALPPDEELMLELSTPVYTINSKGQIQLEPKDKIKQRLGRSPDRAEAVAIVNLSSKLFGRTPPAKVRAKSLGRR